MSSFPQLFPRKSDTPVAEAAAGSMPAALPKPSVFDIVPALHELLGRVLAAPAALDNTADATQDSTGTLPAEASQETSSQQGSSLSIQHLAAESSGIRNRIRAARRAVEELPDVDRTVAQQQEEIRELQEKTEKMQAVLLRLKETTAV